MDNHRPDDAHGPEHLVKLTSVPREPEAKIIVAALREEAQIPAVATGGFTAGFVAEAPGWVSILVAEEDLARAQVFMRDAKLGDLQDAIDWSQIDVGEPE